MTPMLQSDETLRLPRLKYEDSLRALVDPEADNLGVEMVDLGPEGVVKTTRLPGLHMPDPHPEIPKTLRRHPTSFPVEDILGLKVETVLYGAKEGGCTTYVFYVSGTIQAGEATLPFELLEARDYIPYVTLVKNPPRSMVGGDSGFRKLVAGTEKGTNGIFCHFELDD